MSGRFLNPPMAMRTALINGGLPGEVLTEWVGAAEAKRLREDVMKETVAYVAEVMEVPRCIIEGWESGTHAPTPEGVQSPPDFWLRHVYAFYALALHIEKERKGVDVPPARPTRQASEAVGPLLRFLASTDGRGWCGSATELRVLVAPYVEGDVSMLPTFEQGWLQVLRDAAPDLAQAGWVVPCLRLGTPVEFLHYSEAEVG